MNENNTLDEASVITVAPIVKEQRAYTVRDCFLAVICLTIAYVFIRIVLPSLFSVYSTLFMLGYAVVCVIWTARSNAKPRKSAIALFVTALLFSFVMIVTTNDLIRFIALSYSIVLAVYSFYLMNSGDEAFDKGFISRIFRSFFSLPFKSFSDSPKAVASAVKKTGGAGNIKNIIIGLVLAVPLTCVVCSLLFNADKLFEDMFGTFFDGFFDDIWSLVLRLVFVVPLGFYFFGLIYSNVNRKLKLEKIEVETHIITPSVIYTAVTPICVLYAMFFYGQIKYFTSAFFGNLPDGYSYSEYARRGFFELCAVAVINLLVIVLIGVLCKQKDGVKTKGQKTYTTIISSFTLLLIATAMSKMFLYIGEFGLSPLRVYTSWFMILLAIIFVIVIIYQFTEKIKVWKSIFVAFTLMMALLCFGDIDGKIAQYNVAQYQSGALSNVDIEMMYDLSDSAVKYVIPLVNSEDKYVAGEARGFVREKYHAQYDGFKDFNISTLEARSACESFYAETSKNIF